MSQSFYKREQFPGENGIPATWDVAEFDSMAECIMAAKKASPSFDAESIMQLATDGVPGIVKRSDELLGKIEASIDVEGLAPATVPAVTGGAVNIGAFLAGHPMSMRQRRQNAVMSERGAVAIMVDTFGAATTVSAEFKRRGAAILALVRAIQMVRPIQLHLFEHTDDRVLVSVRLPTAPLALSTTGWAVSSLDFTHTTLIPVQNGSSFTGTIRNTSRLHHAGLKVWAERRGMDSLIFVPSYRTGQEQWRSDESAAGWVQEHLDVMKLDAAA
jgi:hypothetical protein